MAEHGASATSMRSLATACHLNVAALYHYFPSKADLLRSVIEERRYGLRLRDAPAIDVTLPPRDRLVALVLAMWDGVREEEAVWRLLLGEALRGDETAAAVGHDILDALAPALRDWLAELFTEPDGTRSLDPDAVADGPGQHRVQLLHRPAVPPGRSTGRPPHATTPRRSPRSRSPRRRADATRRAAATSGSPMLCPTSARVVTSAGSDGSV